MRMNNMTHSNYKIMVMLLRLVLLLVAVLPQRAQADNNKGWSLLLTPVVVTSAGETSGTAVRFGELADAKDSFDFKFDAPVLTLTDTAVACFDRRGWGKGDGKIWYDIQETGAENI